MQTRIVAACFALLRGSHLVGCKSAPKMTWWKSSENKDAVAAAETRSAPELPAEVALQANGLNGSDPVQISGAPATGTAATGGEAPAYNPAASVAGAYPNTGVPSYVPNVAGQTNPAIAAASSTMPYDPNAVPQAKPAVTSGTAAETNHLVAGANQPSVTQSSASAPYSTKTTPFAPTPDSTATAAAGGVAPPYSANPGQTATISQTTPASPTTGAVTTKVGDRYASSAGNSQATSDAMCVSPETSQSVAACEPYRPGGTSSYPCGAMGASYEVASRPDAAGTATQPNGEGGYSSDVGTRYR